MNTKRGKVSSTFVSQWQKNKNVVLDIAGKSGYEITRSNVFKLDNRTVSAVGRFGHESFRPWVVSAVSPLTDTWGQMRLDPTPIFYNI